MAVSFDYTGQGDIVNYILQAGKKTQRSQLFDQNHTAQKKT